MESRITPTAIPVAIREASRAGNILTIEVEDEATARALLRYLEEVSRSNPEAPQAALQLCDSWGGEYQMALAASLDDAIQRGRHAASLERGVNDARLRARPRAQMVAA